MKKIRNIRELQFIKQKLKYKEMLYEKEVNKVSADIVDNLTGKLKDFAFDLGARLIIQLFTSKKKSKASE